MFTGGSEFSDFPEGVRSYDRQDDKIRKLPRMESSLSSNFEGLKVDRLHRTNHSGTFQFKISCKKEKKAYRDKTNRDSIQVS